MAVFKRKGKLFTGPARPHALAADAVLAPRPAEMVKWIRENTPAKLDGLWKAVLPDGATAPPAEYAADLFWLLQQGHILLYTDDTLVVQEQPKPQEPKNQKRKKNASDKDESQMEKPAHEPDSKTGKQPASEDPETTEAVIPDAVEEVSDAALHAAAETAPDSKPAPEPKEEIKPTDSTPASPEDETTEDPKNPETPNT